MKKLKDLKVEEITPNKIFCWAIHLDGIPKPKLLNYNISFTKLFKIFKTEEELLLFLHPYENLVDTPSFNEIKDSDRLIKGGYDSRAIPSELEAKFPKHLHLVFGYTLGACVRRHVEYLLNHVPSQNIYLLTRYSFLPLAYHRVTYERMKVNIWTGTLEDLLKKVLRKLK